MMKLPHNWLLLLLALVFIPHTLAKFEPEITSDIKKVPTQEYLYLDDSPNILALRNHIVEISTDNGKSWKKAEGISDKDEILLLERDKLDASKVYAFTMGKTQFFSGDKGVSWSLFEVDISSGKLLESPPMIALNHEDRNLKLVHLTECQRDLFLKACQRKVYLTKDFFKTKLQPLSSDLAQCTFLKSSPLMKGNKNTILCIEDIVNSFGHVVESKLIKSDDFLKTKTVLNPKYSKSGRVIDVRVQLTFITAVVQNDKFNEKSKVTLLVSKDGENFNVADLETNVSFGSLTFLSSSPLSLFVAITPFSTMFSQDDYSTVYASDSSGLRFHKVSENVLQQDFEKAQTIDGVWLTNIVDGDASKDDKLSLIDLITGGGIDKTVVSRISFDDGKNWQPLAVSDDSCKGSDCSLHLLTPGQMDGEGKFVTGPTPAILVGVGNTGQNLTRSMEHMKTFISRDGGANWQAAIDEPCMFSFGDLGNIIIAVPYFGKQNTSTRKIYYSLDQGLSWETIELEHPIFPLVVTTTIDGTGKKFVVSGLLDNTPDDHNDYDFGEVLYTLDFSKAYDKKCSESDFEEIYARVTPDLKKPICMYGHREKFKRRKADAKCFAAILYEDVTVYGEACECQEVDYECAPGFKSEEQGGHCIPDKRIISQMCKDKKVKELKLPDKVLADGNECSLGKKSEKQFVKEHKLKCSDYVGKHEHNEKIVTYKYDFEGKMKEYIYFNQGDDYNGENIIVHTESDRLFASKTGGVEFVKVPVPDKILAYFMGYVPGQIVLVTSTNTFYLSTDAGNSYVRRHAPLPLSVSSPFISFHKLSTEEFIWYGGENDYKCASDRFLKDCSTTAFITNRNGESFDKLRDDVVKCDFVGSFFEQKTDDNKNLMFCSVLNKKTSQIDLVSSSDRFKSEKVIAENIVGYAISGHYVIVGKVDNKESTLDALVTVDGITFAEASFPRDLDIDIQQSFTVLDSLTDSIFMHVTTDPNSDMEKGAILKSNSNGTSYALSLDNVNRNGQGYVDFDRIEGIEGIVVSNVVSGYKGDKGKRLKTMISHNDGGEWKYIKPPSKDSHGKPFKCKGKTIKDCSLNLHGFTERADYRDTFSSASAIGLMLGIGNVGPTLNDKKDGSLFLTRDGGNKWHEIKKGPYMWEFGDRGNIIVIVKEGKTNQLSYSLDEGRKWHSYDFAKDEVEVVDLATVPSDNSRKFIIFGESNGDTSAFTIDFTGIHDRQCQLDLDNPSHDDFEYWSPSYPDSQDKCLFGHEAAYLRKAHSSNDCFIGQAPLIDGFKIIRNCSCTRQDYECDYNYFRDSDNTCKLVKGLTPSDHKKEMCKNNAFQYFEPTGYRRIPLSTCEGGKQFDAFVPKACPGKTKEFNEYHGRTIGFGKLLLIIGIPLGVFFFATWFVYDRGIRRNGGFKQLGQIRLEDDDFDFHPIENNEVDKAVNTIVRGGIYTVAAAIALVKTFRKFDKVIFDRVIGLIFRRGGRRSYVSVPQDLEDEEELFCNFQDNYEEELEHGDDEDFHQQFSDNIQENETFNEEPESVESDSRLFDIDDQSDEEGRT